MANSFLNPWVLDTANAAAVKSGLSCVQMFSYQGYTTAGHKATIKDSAGRIVAEMIGTAGLPTIQFWMPDEGTGIDGLALTQLDSGRVIVHVA